MSVDHEDWIAAAAGVLERFGGRRALEELEWDAVGDLRDDATRTAFAALFRAQGRVLGATPALGVLVANRLVGSATTDATLAAVTGARVVDGVVDAVALAGSDDAATFVVELTRGDGAIELLAAERSAWAAPSEGPGAFDPSAAHAVRIPRSALRAVAAPDPTPAHLEGVRSSARLAIAHEVLGVCDRLMALAVTYARDRRQFGTPIGAFQAVSHLLAEAEVQRRALQDACETALARSGADGPDPRETVLLKGLAGRTGRTVAQHGLQVLGGIGFTWEHDHHRCSRRVLTLDALFGSVEQMRIRAVGDLAGNGVLRTTVV